MNKRGFLVGGVVAAAAAAAVARVVHPGAADAPSLATGPYDAAPLVQGSFAPRPEPTARPPLPPPAVVYVAGEVRRPGVYRLPAAARVDDAVRAAGGQGPAADPVAVNLAERVRDGEEIVVPPRGAGPPPARDFGASPKRRRRRRRSSSTRSAAARTASAGSAETAAGAEAGFGADAGLSAAAGNADGAPVRSHRPGGRGRKPPPDAPVDVNAADATQLEALPGVGRRLAERIVEFRETNGPFASADELLDVNGVSERLLDEISPYVTFGPR